jgi:hypothetical protein
VLDKRSELGSEHKLHPRRKLLQTRGLLKHESRLLMMVERQELRVQGHDSSAHGLQLEHETVVVAACRSAKQCSAHVRSALRVTPGGIYAVVNGACLELMGAEHLQCLGPGVLIFLDMGGLGADARVLLKPLRDRDETIVGTILRHVGCDRVSGMWPGASDH